MSGTLSLQEIVHQLQAASGEFTGFCNGINDETFFYQPADKWSIAQNVHHLIISSGRTKLVYSLPKFIVRIVAGKPNRPSRTYDELVAKYKLKLAQGGRASGSFIPKPISPKAEKRKMLQHFSSSMKQLAERIQKNWTDKQLDLFIAPHPLLGKITLRELCYFTIHHTYHHLDSIKTRLLERETIQ